MIVIARRRAGLSQQRLAGRLGVPQGTVARWESGTTEPKFQAVQKAVKACGLDMTLGFAKADEGSWNSLIYEQLLRTPAERVRKLSRDGFDRVETLKLIGASRARAIVVGATADALHGWPLVLDGHDGIDLLVHDDDRERVEEMLALVPHRERVHLLDELSGAWGYADLARNATAIEVDGVAVRVTSLIDLLRVALSETGGFSSEFALAFDATLQLSEHLRQPDRPPVRELGKQEAREEADRWLATHAAA